MVDLSYLASQSFGRSYKLTLREAAHLTEQIPQSNIPLLNTSSIYSKPFSVAGHINVTVTLSEVFPGFSGFIANR